MFLKLKQLEHFSCLVIHLLIMATITTLPLVELSDTFESEATGLLYLIFYEYNYSDPSLVARLKEMCEATNDADTLHHIFITSQEKYKKAMASVALLEKRVVMAESLLEATLQYESGQVKALSSPRSARSPLKLVTRFPNQPDIATLHDNFVMVAGRKTQPFMVNGSSPATQHLDTTCSSACIRNLRKNQLGGVIFGCNNLTIKECLFKQIFAVFSSMCIGYGRIDIIL